MRYLALDVGERRIGVALSDETATLATGLDTLTRVGSAEGRRRPSPRWCAEHGPAAVVVGLPLNMDGTAGAQAEKVRAFVDGLKRRITVPIVERDERLTTVEAHEILRKSGVAWRQRGALLDKVSAVVILQEFLDHQRAAGHRARLLKRAPALLSSSSSSPLVLAAFWFHETQLARALGAGSAAVADGQPRGRRPRHRPPAPRPRPGPPPRHLPRPGRLAGRHRQSCGRGSTRSPGR